MFHSHEKGFTDMEDNQSYTIRIIDKKTNYNPRET